MNELNHIAIIMDGNGRWGLKKKGSRNYGHLHGIKTVETVIKSSLIKKIPHTHRHSMHQCILLDILHIRANFKNKESEILGKINIPL